MNIELHASIGRRPGGWRALSDLPDENLVELTRSGDLTAFEALMRRHNRRLFRVARSVLRDADAAEDAVQEAYLRAYTKLSTYKPTGKFSAWLTRVALNEALMIRRRDRSDTVSARSRRRIIKASLSATRVIHALKWPVGL